MSSRNAKVVGIIIWVMNQNAAAVGFSRRGGLSLTVRFAAAALRTSVRRLPMDKKTQGGPIDP
jgi:hypothetical protein